MVDDRAIGVMQADIGHLKADQSEMKDDIKEIRSDTSEIKVLLVGGKQNGFASNRVLVWVIVGLITILGGVLGITIPI